MSYRLHLTPLSCSSCSVSCRLKGRIFISRVIRLYKPPLLLTKVCFIQDVAEPHTMSIRSSCRAPHPFQKCSNAVMKRERGVSSHGISSINTTWRFPFFLRMSKDLSNSKASNQFFGCGTSESRPYERKVV